MTKEQTCYPACACQCGCPPEEAAKPREFQQSVTKEPIRSIKVLDNTEQTNRQLYLNVLQAVQQLNLSPVIQYLSEAKQTSSYFVDLPALLIDERIVSYGKICTVEDIKTLLQK